MLSNTREDAGGLSVQGHSEGWGQGSRDSSGQNQAQVRLPCAVKPIC